MAIIFLLEEDNGNHCEVCLSVCFGTRHCRNEKGVCTPPLFKIGSLLRYQPSYVRVE